MPPKRNDGEKLDFAAQMALAMSQPSQRKSRSSSNKTGNKDDIFKKGKAKGDAAKRAARDHVESPAFAQQKHSTTTPSLDNDEWALSRAKMEEKAKIYNAIKRGDAEDVGGRYEVDFDRKWAEKQEAGVEDASEDEFSGGEEGGSARELVEVTDEFGRVRSVDKKEAARLKRARKAEERGEMLRGELRAQAPSGVIYGDVIQSEAFTSKDGMAHLAAKRDKYDPPHPLLRKSAASLSVRLLIFEALTNSATDLRRRRPSSTLTRTKRLVLGVQGFLVSAMMPRRGGGRLPSWRGVGRRRLRCVARRRVRRRSWRGREWRRRGRGLRPRRARSARRTSGSASLRMRGLVRGASSRVARLVRMGWRKICLLGRSTDEALGGFCVMR